MKDITANITTRAVINRGWFWILGLILALVVMEPLLPAFLVDLPDGTTVPLSDWIGQGLNWFAREASIFGISIADMTRGIAALAAWPINALQVVLADGLVSGAGFNKTQILPPVSWLSVTLFISLVSLRFVGVGFAVVTLIAGAYLALFGLWVSAMITLASILLCVVVALVLGLLIGIRAHRSPGIEPAIRAIMNVMQTVPIFSYLLPTLLLFGYGPSAALFATVVYALPPMVHATVLALHSVPSETLELAHMSGCTRRQTLWKVEIPVAVPRLAIGLNQVVMMTLNMVIIASMIGAGGLGYDVLRALRRLDFGAGFEAGMGIVVLAIVLDRLTQAAARNRSTGRLGLWRFRDTKFALALLLIPTILSLFFPALATWPKDWTLTTAPFWNGAVSFVNQTFYDPLEAVRTAMLLGVMNPFRDALLSLPWAVVVVVLLIAGWRLAEIKTGLTLAAMAVFVALTGFWDAAMGSVYLTTLSVVIALAMGIPLGILISSKARLQEPVQFILDTLQTLPTLVYLLPAVMLFRNGDFSAMIAIVSYAIAPAIRYGIDGMRHVPSERIEAAAMSGCSKWQTLRHVKLPAAMPTLLLGVNQTIMMALSMLVIAALVGTRELGQEVFTALSRGETGPGIVAGLCVACVALIADTLLKTSAAKAASQQGE